MRKDNPQRATNHPPKPILISNTKTDKCKIDIRFLNLDFLNLKSLSQYSHAVIDLEEHAWLIYVVTKYQEQNSKKFLRKYLLSHPTGMIRQW